jgi:hypothetical protein
MKWKVQQQNQSNMVEKGLVRSWKRNLKSAFQGGLTSLSLKSEVFFLDRLTANFLESNNSEVEKSVISTFISNRRYLSSEIKYGCLEGMLTK